MTDRKIGDHLHVLHILTVKVRQITERRWPQRQVCDFLLALWAAVEIDLPHGPINGFSFNFNQSFWRTLQNLGLMASYIR